ncbi:MAG: hypothetical protein M3R04_09155 [bacterium]|nr:hypothetical protein [bacterium]
MPTLPFSNFTKGEISPELQARLDTQQYGAAARKVRNFIIQRYGGLSFRPGFRYVGEVDDVTHNIKYIPFQYNMEQSYIMAMSNQKMRLLTGGGFVLEIDNDITAITKAATAQITAANHGYVVGDKIYFSGIVGMDELNGRVGTVATVVNANNFTININTTTYTTFVSSTGTVAAAPPAAPPASIIPPVPPVQPPPAPITAGGGTGGLLGGIPGWKGPDGYAVRTPEY